MPAPNRGKALQIRADSETGEVVARRRQRQGATGGESVAVTPEPVADALRDAIGPATARLTRALGDVWAADDAVQDAALLALERWPEVGIPAGCAFNRHNWVHFQPALTRRARRSRHPPR